jgi:hypothetical protein
VAILLNPNHRVFAQVSKADSSLASDTSRAFESDTVILEVGSFRAQVKELRTWLLATGLIADSNTVSYDASSRSRFFPFDEHHLMDELFGDSSRAIISPQRIAAQQQIYDAWSRLVARDGSNIDVLARGTIASTNQPLRAALPILQCILPLTSHYLRRDSLYIAALQSYNSRFVKYNESSWTPDKVDIVVARSSLDSMLLNLNGLPKDTGTCAGHLRTDTLVQSTKQRLIAFREAHLNGSGIRILPDNAKVAFSEIAFAWYTASDNHERLLTTATRFSEAVSHPPAVPDVVRVLAALFSFRPKDILEPGWFDSRASILNRWIEDSGLTPIVGSVRAEARADGSLYVSIPRRTLDKKRDANDTWSALTKRLRRAGRGDLAERLFIKVANTYLQPLSATTLDLSAYCDGLFLYWEHGRIETSGLSCTSARSSVSVAPFDFERIRAGTSASRSVSLGTQRRDFSGALYYVLVGYLKGRGVSVDQVDRLQVENNVVQVFIRDLRGYVIHGRTYWENLQLTFSIQNRQSGTRLECVADGQYGVGVIIDILGLHHPPAPTAFRDMEPVYKKPLQTFTSELLYRLKDLLEGETR